MNSKRVVSKSGNLIVGSVLLLAALGFASCATTAPDNEPPVERVLSSNLIDPRLGFPPAAKKVEERFDAAWNTFSRGELASAERRFSDILRKSPGYSPATLGLAAVNIERGNLDGASGSIEQLRQTGTAPAATLYAAEVAYLRHDLEMAWKLYSEGASASGPVVPVPVSSRLSEIRKELFEQRLVQARAEKSDEKAVRQLRSALMLEPESKDARSLLARRLIELKKFEEARKEIAPLLGDPAADSDEVQQSLAEIDAGKGRFEEAIGRYEKLSRKGTNPAFGQRLNELKRQWSESNMPPHYLQAMASDAITRGDLAILLYWKVSPIHFAQRLAEPPIAIDTDIAGRDEVIRALALRLLQADPITRRVDPYRTVNGSSFLRVAGRALGIRGTPACASSVPPASESDASRASRLLTSCGIRVDDVRETDPTVKGSVAARVLEGIDRQLVSSEK